MPWRRHSKWPKECTYISSCPSNICLKQYPSTELSYLENQLNINTRAYFWTFNYMLMIYVSVLMPVLHCLHYCSFVLSFKITEVWIFLPFNFLSFCQHQHLHKDPAPTTLPVSANYHPTLYFYEMNVLNSIGGEIIWVCMHIYHIFCIQSSVYRLLCSLAYWFIAFGYIHINIVPGSYWRFFKNHFYIYLHVYTLSGPPPHTCTSTPHF
jgi:hypothetical protein